MSSTPGSRALKVAKAQNAALAEFKRPLANTKVERKIKPKLLTEERYIEEISKIIQRDFFPDLERLRAQNDYLDAESRRDFQQMAEIRARFSLGSANRTVVNNHNKARSPSTFETPISEGSGSITPRPEALLGSQPSDAEGVKQDVLGCRNMSLDAFLQRYTSEDNHSFQEIIEEAKVKLRMKYSVLYKHEQLSADKLQHLLTLPSIDQQFKAADSSRKIDTWKYTNLNSVMYMPDGVEQSAEGKHGIRHKATRLPANVANLPKTNAMGDEKAQASRTCGYDLLRSPSPCPGKTFSPIMTWGEIDGTPFRLDGGDTPLTNIYGRAFHINENSHRENIAIALADKVSEKMRNQKQQQALNKTHRNNRASMGQSSMERLASMSPAARRLASSKLGLRTNCTPLLTPSLGHELKSRIKTVTHPGHEKHQTPARVSSGIRSTPVNTGSSLTDNLLKLPAKRRNDAADFF